MARVAVHACGATDATQPYMHTRAGPCWRCIHAPLLLLLILQLPPPDLAPLAQHTRTRLRTGVAAAAPSAVGQPAPHPTHPRGCAATYCAALHLLRVQPYQLIRQGAPLLGPCATSEALLPPGWWAPPLLPPRRGQQSRTLRWPWCREGSSSNSRTRTTPITSWLAAWQGRWRCSSCTPSMSSKPGCKCRTAPALRCLSTRAP